MMIQRSLLPDFDISSPLLGRDEGEGREKGGHLNKKKEVIYALAVVTLSPEERVGKGEGLDRRGRSEEEPIE